MPLDVPIIYGGILAVWHSAAGVRVAVFSACSSTECGQQRGRSVRIVPKHFILSQRRSRAWLQQRDSRSWSSARPQSATSTERTGQLIYRGYDVHDLSAEHDLRGSGLPSGRRTCPRGRSSIQAEWAARRREGPSPKAKVLDFMRDASPKPRTPWTCYRTTVSTSTRDLRKSRRA